MFVANEFKRVRMTEEDRQAVNRMIRDKRSQFEAVIIKGVIAMLNEQSERLKLQAERQNYLSALTHRNKQKKQQLSDITSLMKDATSSAPAGMGAASNMLLSSATTLGNALYDKAEEKRQDLEAEQQLESAQFLYYIPSDDYQHIADQVANILSYRFQFLIFRLAAGEDGYMKLARFFITSMQAYAIERLREHKDEHIKALIHAAIPPSANARRYREWPSLDLDNFRMKLDFGYRKTLATDPIANQIVSRCGPAVRAFLGGYQAWVDPTTRKETEFSNYTLLGALHHAMILNHHGEVLSGLGISKRNEGVLRGDNKYPMLLLGCNETSSDMGVNVATFQTTLVIQDAHTIVLKRLVPDFFSHFSPYESLEKKSKTYLLMTNDEKKYPEERYEIPWTDTREAQWKHRWKTIYVAANKSLAEREITTISHFSKLITMRNLGNQFDANEAKNDVLLAANEARSSFHGAYSNFSAEQSTSERVNTMIAAKYLAITVKKFLLASVQPGLSLQQDFELFANWINFTKLVLSASLDLPNQEVNRFVILRQCSARINTEAAQVEVLRSLTVKNGSLLMASLNKALDKSPIQKLYVQVMSIFRNRAKRIKAQHTNHIQDFEASVHLANLIRKWDMRSFSGRTSQQLDNLLLELDQTADAIYLSISSFQENDDLSALKKVIDILQIESQILYSEIRSFLNDEHYNCNLDASWLDPATLQNLGLDQQIDSPKTLAELNFFQIQTKVNTANDLISSREPWRLVQPPRQYQTLIQLLQSIKAHRDLYVQMLANTKPKEVLTAEQHDATVALEAAAMITRLKAYRRIGILCLLVSKNNDHLMEQTIHKLEYYFHAIYQVSLQMTLLDCETVFHDISSESQAESDTDRIGRYHVDAEKLFLARRKLDQVLYGDLDNLAVEFNYAQLVVTNMAYILGDHGDLNDKIEVFLTNSDNVIPFPTSAAALAGIQRLIRAFSETDSVSISADAQGDFEEKEAYVYVTLQQLIAQTTAHNLYIWITKEQLYAQINDQLLSLQGKMNAGTALSEDWGLRMIAQTVQWLNHELMTHQTWGIDACLAKANTELNTMKQHMQQESPNLTVARRSVFQELGLIYHYLGEVASKKLRPPTHTSLADTVAESMIVSLALAWAARPNHLEQQWLDARMVEKYKPKLRFATNHRAPIILLMTALVTYFSEKIEQKNQSIRKLRELNILQSTCSKLMYEIKSSPVYKEVKKLDNQLSTKRKTLELLTKIMEKKLQDTRHEKDEWISTRANILEQRLKIYFDEWKKKIAVVEDISERRKAIKQATLEQITHLKTQKPSSEAAGLPVKLTMTADGENKDNAPDKDLPKFNDIAVKEDAYTYYTLEIIEETLKTFEVELNSLKNEMSPSLALSPQLRATMQGSFFRTTQRMSSGNFASSSPGQSITPPSPQPVQKNIEGASVNF